MSVEFLSDARRDMVVGLLAAGLGGALLVWGIPLYVQEDPDLRLPVSLMPRIIALLFLVVGMIQAARALLIMRKVDTTTLHEDLPAGEPVGRVVAIFAMLVVSAAAMHWLPFLIVMPLLMLGLALFHGGSGLVRPLLVAILASAAIYAVVRHGFEMLLP